MAAGTIVLPGEPIAVSPAARDAGFDAKVLRSREALDGLAEGWRLLEGRASGATPFQSLAWARAIFDFEARRGNAGFDPVIAVLQDAGRLVAVLPLERIATAARVVLVPLGNGFTQYADMLLETGQDPELAVKQLLAAATRAARCDVVSLLKVREGSCLAQGLPATRIETGAAMGAPYVALNAFADFASYFATIRTKTRKNMRNARNRLEREGAVEHHVVPPTERGALIERTLAGRAERLREQGLTSRAFRDGKFPDFCIGLAGRDDIDLLAFSLTHKGKPIAEQWGFVHGGRYYAYVAARDFSNSDESPGKLQLGEIIRVCSDLGLSGCDLGVPAMPYKMTFATETVPVRDFALPVTAKGRLVTQAWDVMLRPALKATMLRMPAGLRARILEMTGGH